MTTPDPPPQQAASRRQAAAEWATKLAAAAAGAAAGAAGASSAIGWYRRRATGGKSWSELRKEAFEQGKVATKQVVAERLDKIVPRVASSLPSASWLPSLLLACSSLSHVSDGGHGGGWMATLLSRLVGLESALLSSAFVWLAEVREGFALALRGARHALTNEAVR